MLDATNPGAIQAAGQAYKAASQKVAAIRDAVSHASRTLSEVWEDEAATAAQEALRKLQTTADQLATATAQMGATLDWYGGEILPWYVAHKPDTGLIKDGGDDDYAREYMQRLNRRIAEAWTRLPESVSEEPLSKDRGNPVPQGLSLNTTTGATADGNVPTGAGSGSQVGAGRSGYPSSDTYQEPLGDQEHARPRQGTHPASLDGIGSGYTTGSGTDLASFGSGGAGTVLSGLATPPGPSGAVPTPTGPAGGAPGAPGVLAPLGPGAGGLPGSGAGARPGPLPGSGAGTFPGNARSAAGAAGGVGRGGSGPAGPFGPSGAGQGRKDDRERQREFWLAEDRETWGGEHDAAPPTIGTDPSCVVDVDNAEEATLAENVWGAEAAVEAVIGHSGTPTEPPGEGHESPRESLRSADSDAENKPRERKDQGPPYRLEAPSDLRGE